MKQSCPNPMVFREGRRGEGGGEKQASLGIAFDRYIVGYPNQKRGSRMHPYITALVKLFSLRTRPPWGYFSHLWSCSLNFFFVWKLLENMKNDTTFVRTRSGDHIGDAKCRKRAPRSVELNFFVNCNKQKRFSQNERRRADLQNFASDVLIFA